MIKDLNEAEQRGWAIGHHVEVRKGDHVVRGTHDEVVKHIAELERVEAMEAERRAAQAAQAALENDPITKLVRRVRACAREHEYQSDRYHAASIDKEGQAAHVTRLRALDSMNEQLGNMNEALGEILRQPKEALGANPEWQRLKRSLP